MFTVLAALAVLSAPPKSGPDPTWFPFVIPWDGIQQDSAPDVSFLNEKPAGKNGFIVVKDGQFKEQKTQKRIKFLGVNITARQAFPTKTEATKIAKRLAQLGMNVVRFHHMQQSWDPDGMIWKKGKENLELDPIQLDKLDYFISELKKNGIYTNINLQTTRTYQPEQGFPESVKEIPFGFCKRIDKVDRKMIALQKEYAKQLLDRVNPYTKLAYKDEPALVMVEINNENSLVGDPWDGGLGKLLDTLPTYFKNQIIERWNQWLTKKYQNDANLRQAWSKGATELGAVMTPPPSQWRFENHSNGDVQFSTDKATGGGAPALKVVINNNPGPSWHVQANIVGLDFKEGQFYTVKFKAKADRYRTMDIAATLDQDDWHSIGLATAVPLNDVEKEFSYVFKATRVVENHARVTFILGATTGTISIRDLVVRQGKDSFKLAAGQSLAAKNIEIPSTDADEVKNDWVAFLLDTEKAYTDEMLQYLRKDLGLKANIIDTQVSWGGLTGIKREENADYADNHAYWEHPAFPRKAWDASDWTINNTPMVDDLGKQGGTLLYLASTRVWGKPYTLSEYNHPAPSDYQVEMMPVLAAFAAQQDWDAVFGFDYGETQESSSNNAIQGFFALGTNPAKMAFYSTAALMFRSGLVQSSTARDILELNAKPWEQAMQAYQLWLKRGPLPDWTKSKLGVTSGNAVKGSSLTLQPLKLIPNGQHTDFVVDCPSTQAVVGFLGGRKLKVGNTSLEFGSFDNGFAAWTMVAQDQKALPESSRVLITLAGRVENMGMKWNETRNSVGTNWGKGPTLAQSISCKVTLKSSKTKKVYALGGDGKRLKMLPSEHRNGFVSFTINREAKSLWFEIVD